MCFAKTSIYQGLKIIRQKEASVCLFFFFFFFGDMLNFIKLIGTKKILSQFLIISVYH